MTASRTTARIAAVSAATPATPAGPAAASTPGGTSSNRPGQV